MTTGNCIECAGARPLQRRSVMRSDHRILVAFGSERGSTPEIAESIAATLRERGLAVDCLPAAEIRDLAPYDAVIVGDALHLGGWYHQAHRFVTHHATALRRRAVWMFSSGSLDEAWTTSWESPNRVERPVPARVAVLMDRVGARGHTTFEDQLAAGAERVPGAAMACHAWADRLAERLLAVPPVVAGPIATPPRWLLATLCLSVGITAIGGGLALILRPDGSLLHMPLSMLAHSPFSSFLVPGLLLVFVVGLDALIAGVLVVRDSPIANAAALMAGAALFIWIVAEMLFLRSVHALALGYLAAAGAILGEALRRSRRGEWSPTMHAFCT